jgi:hypothetical protein
LYLLFEDRSLLPFLSDKPTTQQNTTQLTFLLHATDEDDEDVEDDDEELRLFPSLMAFQMGPRTTGKERRRVWWRSGM